MAKEVTKYLKGHDGRCYKKCSFGFFVYRNKKWEDSLEVPCDEYCTVLTIKSGQERRYGDTHYEYKLTFSTNKTKAEVMNFIRKLIDKDETPEYGEKYGFEGYHKISGNNNEWHYYRLQPFLD